MTTFTTPQHKYPELFPDEPLPRHVFQSRHVTHSVKEFVQMCVAYPDRLRIVVEGDSWVSIPDTWGVKPRNITDFLAEHADVNILTLATAGDELLNMLSGPDKALLLRVLAEHDVDTLVLSGGGNDLLGPYEFPRLLYTPDMEIDNPLAWVNLPVLYRRIGLLTSMWEELLDYVREFAKAAHLRVYTHTYGYVRPSGEPSIFLGGLKTFGPWLAPVLRARGIPERLWQPVINTILEYFMYALDSVQLEHHDRLTVIHTEDLVQTEEWADEIHPTTAAFQRIADVYYTTIRHDYDRARCGLAACSEGEPA